MQTVELDRLLDGAAVTDDGTAPPPVGPAVSDHPVRVLDVGCGEGRHMHAAALHDADAEVVGVDLDREVLRRARADFEEYVAPELVTRERDTDGDGTVSGSATGGGHGGAFALGRADALTLPFPDGTFDAVICSEVLEHLPDYERAVDELVRVLRPGGWLGVSVPRYGPEAVCWRLSDKYHQTEGGHVRIFRRDELESTLESRGLRLVGSHFAHALHSPYWWLKCLWWDRADEAPPLPLSAYERLLEWDVMNEPAVTRVLERALDPLLGKSLVLYYER